METLNRMEEPLTSNQDLPKKSVEDALAEDHAARAPKKSNRGRPKKKNFNRVWKDDVTFTHDLIRLETAVCIKNLGHDPADPQWLRREHKHFYHSFSSSGKAQKYSSETNGHFHEVEIEYDDAGEIKNVKCGPALKWAFRKIPQKGVKRFPVPVEYSIVNRNGQRELLVDDHHHDVNYEHSEEMSKADRSKRTNANAGSIMAAHSQLDTTKATVKDDETGGTVDFQTSPD